MGANFDKLIILDLDETLVHASEYELTLPCDFMVNKYFVYKRPYLDQFLTALSTHFSIGIWSSADDNYVAEIVARLTTAQVNFTVVWGRSKCSLRHDLTFDTYCFEKRLDKLKKKGFNLEKILVIDDSPEKSRTNYGNAIHIKEFTGDINDGELQFLFNYLLTLKAVDNVRAIEKRNWRQQTENKT